LCPTLTISWPAPPVLSTCISSKQFELTFTQRSAELCTAIRRTYLTVRLLAVQSMGWSNYAPSSQTSTRSKSTATGGSSHARPETVDRARGRIARYDCHRVSRGQRTASAAETIRNHETLVLRDAARDVFINALLNPPRPNEALRSAARRYRAGMGL